MSPLDAIGSPVRRDILLALRDAPMSVNELADRFPVSRPSISRHLRVLQEAGLVEYRDVGAKNLYAVRIEGFEPLRAFLDSFWDAALERIQELARR
jgi:DNA-binding transcriptional ArsR family regulator